uniref:Uncharacterized protein n=1 Tax=Moschus moschiferus TaxID=68415 RepID=A0A8C6DKJ3_MOSMO
MIPAFPANNQWTWFPRIAQEEVSRRCWLCFYLLYAVTLALMLGGVFITLFSGHPPFALFPPPCCHSMLPTITEDPAPASHSGFSRGLLQILIDPSKTIGAQLMASLPGSALILSIVLSCKTFHHCCL